MSTWQAISEAKLQDEIEAAVARMKPELKRLWDLVRIRPAKWKGLSQGEMGGGFWAVAVIGQEVIWYNDVEEGFNTSRYESYGIISEYWCNQDQLEWALQDILQRLSGSAARPKLGPP